MLSREGVQQGDPLGPFLFSLAIAELVNKCQSSLNIWYLDDASLAGDPDKVLQDLMNIKEASSDLGLEMEPSKCELYFKNGTPSERQETKALFEA